MPSEKRLQHLEENSIALEKEWQSFKIELRKNALFESFPEEDFAVPPVADPIDAAAWRMNLVRCCLRTATFALMNNG